MVDDTDSMIHDIYSMMDNTDLGEVSTFYFLLSTFYFPLSTKRQNVRPKKLQTTFTRKLIAIAIALLLWTPPMSCTLHKCDV